ncbi:MAG TPA: AbrB/MazE/SpoVT family DNA-binding domain-containing protein [bacterium]|jgi:AbrB family looped-hinge helix DNA binding protein|nr:AbrB/MazE/SpoVT family DNA-binding domain-containing protein [bacterium]HNT67094.1 AbrB/MazE/SpoVT family DNA-binding domain-containing protein [bacterium]
MSTIETTKMSSKGQVVIPETIRKKLGLKAGSQFIVVGDRDVVILKSIEPPSMNEFDEIIDKARTQARMVGLSESDIHEAIKKARG